MWFCPELLLFLLFNTLYIFFHYVSYIMSSSEKRVTSKQKKHTSFCYSMVWIITVTYSLWIAVFNHNKLWPCSLIISIAMASSRPQALYWIWKTSEPRLVRLPLSELYLNCLTDSFHFVSLWQFLYLTRYLWPIYFTCVYVVQV